MSSPWLQHTPGGGRNASRASKPVLFTNKMQLWMNHRLSPTCWHTHPLCRKHTCLDTAGTDSSTCFMPNSHHLLLSAQQCEPPLKKTLTSGLKLTDAKQPQRGVFRDLSSGFDWVTSLSFKWRLSLHHTWFVWVTFKSSPAHSPAQYRQGTAGYSDWSESSRAHAEINQHYITVLTNTW